MPVTQAAVEGGIAELHPAPHDRGGAGRPRAGAASARPRLPDRARARRSAARPGHGRALRPAGQLRRAGRRAPHHGRRPADGLRPDRRSLGRLLGQRRDDQGRLGRGGIDAARRRVRAHRRRRGAAPHRPDAGWRRPHHRHRLVALLGLPRARAHLPAPGLPTPRRTADGRARQLLRPLERRRRRLPRHDRALELLGQQPADRGGGDGARS